MGKKHTIARLSVASFSIGMTFLLCTLVLSPLTMCAGQWSAYGMLTDDDSLGVSGSDMEIDNGADQDIFTSLAPYKTTISPDTLHTYTLSGLRLDGKRKTNARILYNIIIRNGRRVVR